jgi:hypothetical protein
MKMKHDLPVLLSLLSRVLTQAVQQLREKMDKWEYMKLKSFCTTKEMVSKLKRKPRVGKKFW